MKISAIASRYSIKGDKFEDFLRAEKLPYDEGVFSASVKDENVDEYVTKYKEYVTKTQKEIEDQKQMELEEAQRKKKCLAEMLISSGFSFDGYTITKYSGYISGDDATEIPRSGFFSGGKNGSNLTDALVKIRRVALKELKEAAYNLGCNAVIGVDFDYMTLEPETYSLGNHYLEPYVICVTANGNAVVVEKNK